MGKIFYLMGKSSVGKDSIYKKLLKIPRLYLKKIVSYTTRPIRDGEKDGFEYFFVTADKFKEYKKSGKIIECRSYDTVYGLWYYFLVDDGQINFKKSNYLLIGTLEGYISLVNYFGKERIVPLYIEVDDGIRLQRALDRENSQDNPHYEEMCRRFLADSQDFSDEKIISAGIQKRFNNYELENVIKELVDFIELSK